MRTYAASLGLLMIAASAINLAAGAASPAANGSGVQGDLQRLQEGRGSFRPRIEKDLQVERDIVYGSEQPGRQSLDLYTLKNRDKPMPLVVWIHGGAWMAGDKQRCPAQRLMYDGFAAASINYRYSSMAKFPAQIYDCKAAIRWLRANAEKYNIDPNHIGVWGASAGGHLAALLGTTNGNKQLEGTVGQYLDTSSDVQAVCDWFGPSDFFAMPVGRRMFEPGKDPETLLFGGPVSENRRLAEMASPFFHAAKKTVPFLIMHGDADNLVPVEQSKSLYEKLKAAGTDAELIILAGQGHGFSEEAQALGPVRKFFIRTLRQAKPLR